MAWQGVKPNPILTALDGNMAGGQSVQFASEPSTARQREHREHGVGAVVIGLIETVRTQMALLTTP